LMAERSVRPVNVTPSSSALQPFCTNITDGMVCRGLDAGYDWRRHPCGSGI
jgi:hypothetical protein